jgi:hypothetical protein
VRECVYGISFMKRSRLPPSGTSCIDVSGVVFLVLPRILYPRISLREKKMDATTLYMFLVRQRKRRTIIFVFIVIFF